MPPNLFELLVDLLVCSLDGDPALGIEVVDMLCCDCLELGKAGLGAVYRASF
jgi:hypothetical protein